ncbi:membrane protein, partial [gut metagenome]
MTFSSLLALLVWITLSAFFITSIVVAVSPRRRQAVTRLLAKPVYQTLAMLLTAGIGISLLSAVPVERAQQTDTLLQVTFEAIGAGLPEKAASAPFATVDINGNAL